MSYKNNAFIFFAAIIVSQASIHGMEWREEFKLGKYTTEIGSFVCSHCRFETKNTHLYQWHKNVEHRDNSTLNASDWRSRFPQLNQSAESTSPINHVHFEPTAASEIVSEIQQPTEKIVTTSPANFNEPLKAYVTFSGNACSYCDTKEHNLNRHMRVCHGSSVAYGKRFPNSVTHKDAEKRPLTGGKLRLHSGK
jgi:hypothetical protein